MSEGPQGRIRRQRFQRGLTVGLDTLEESDGLIPDRYISNGPPIVSDSQVTDVVFVIHGIRDREFWTQKIAIRVLGEAARKNRQARSMTLSYGYLAMGPFVLPWVRREKVRWLMDRYADCRAKYPKATFHYVGHSNGTYLAARALQDYPAARFGRIVFAGSVVDPRYDWAGAMANPRRQVDGVLNYVASRDLVVAIFPNGLSAIPMLDLGGAGHRGFEQLNSGARPAINTPSIITSRIGEQDSHEVTFVAGGHGAGIRESQWDDMAQFIIDGSPPLADDPDFIGKQSSAARFAGWLPPASLALLAGAIFVPVAMIDRYILRTSGTWAAVLAILLEFVLFWIVITRV